jgi:dTDP-4-amino-4,6-dideoxygalactose transaminase
MHTKSFGRSWPIFDENEEKALLKAPRSRNWCRLRGNAVYDFQKEFAEAMGVRYCVLTNGGTTAPSTSLHCLGVGSGNEVITTPNTFIATINVICNTHALQVFVDIDQAFRKSFSQAHLKKYRESLQMPIIDNIRPSGKEKFPLKVK